MCSLSATPTALANSSARSLRVTRSPELQWGLPVLGHETATLRDNADRVVVTNGPPAPASFSARVEKADGASSPKPAFDVEAARRVVAATGARPGIARLMVVPGGATLRLAYVVHGRTWQPFGLFNYIVDASTGKVIGKRKAFRRAHGRVYENSPHRGSGIVDVELPFLRSDATLTGDFAEIFAAGKDESGNVTRARAASPNSSGDFVFEPNENAGSDPFAEVQAYHHISRVHDWFRRRFGFERTTRATGQRIDVFVNAADPDDDDNDNAYFGDYDGDGAGDLVFGRGTKFNWVYDAEIIYHEFTHSVIGEGPKLDGTAVDALGFFGEPAALDEGFADYFSATLVGDPAVGEHVGQDGSDRALRTLVDSEGTRATCPDSLTGEPHTDSLPWSRALWEIREALGADRADGAIWAALQALVPTSSFAQAAETLTRVSEATLPTPDAARVRDILARRGLPTCQRISMLAHEHSRVGTVSGGNPHALQYRVEVPPNATSLTIVVTPDDTNARLVPHLRLGELVAVTPGDEVTYTSDFTAKPKKRLVLTVNSTARPLTPGATYHLLIVNTKDEDADFHVTARVSSQSDPADEAGANDGSTDAPSTAVGCALSPHERPHHTAPCAMIIVLLAAVPYIQRRRRRRR